VSQFENPKNRVLLIECADDAEIIRIGQETGLLREISPCFGLEWPPEIMVLGARPGYRYTGETVEVENEGVQPVMEWSKTQYALIYDADMDDPRYQAFRIVREPQAWIIPGWDREE
jgi:hypothetical protein